MTPIEDDFNPLFPSVDGETPTWSEIIKGYVEAGLLETHTWLPAIVLTVKGTNRVDLQPLLLRQFKSSPVPLPLPVIQDVMVVTPRGNTYGMHLPIKIGDVGLALFCERSLQAWSQLPVPAAIPPLDTRHHDLSDAVFIPGLYPFLAPIPPPMGANPLDLVVYNGLAQIYLQPTGQFKIVGVGLQDAMKLILQTMLSLQLTLTTLSTTTVASVPLSTAAVFTTAAADLAKTIAFFTALVGV